MKPSISARDLALSARGSNGGFDCTRGGLGLWCGARGSMPGVAASVVVTQTVSSDHQGRKPNPASPPTANLKPQTRPRARAKTKPRPQPCRQHPRPVLTTEGLGVAVGRQRCSASSCPESSDTVQTTQRPSRQTPAPWRQCRLCGYTTEMGMEEFPLRSTLDQFAGPQMRKGHEPRDLDEPTPLTPHAR